MELKEEINITRQLLKELADDAWISYRGNYSFYNYFVNTKFERLDYIEERLNELTPEEEQKYLNEVVNMHNMLSSYNVKDLKNKIIEKETKKDEQSEKMSFNDDEINELLDSLEENKPETSYPMEDFNQEFVPLDLPDIPSDNPIQPGDIEKKVNLPK